MEYARLIGQLMLRSGWYDRTAPLLEPDVRPPAPPLAEAVTGPRPRRARVTGIAARIRKVLADAYPDALTGREIAERSGLTTLQVHSNIIQMNGIERTGERMHYLYRIVKYD